VVNREATKDDKVMVDLEMFLDRVPLDGGQARNHAIYLSEPYYLPGLTEQLVGMKKGDVKEFELEFPKDSHQKNMAGRKVKFRVTVHDVFEVVFPELDDVFATTLGQKTMDDLKALLKENMTNEAEMKERDRQDIDMLKAIAAKSTFDDIPDALLTNESRRMMDELEQNVIQQGAEFDKYLESIKKTREQVLLDFVPQAIERVKTALVIRAVAAAEKIEVTEKELTEETDRMKQMYKNDEDTTKHLDSNDGQEHLRGVLRNRKTLASLREKVTVKA
jgi:trigger factor